MIIWIIIAYIVVGLVVAVIVERVDPSSDPTLIGFEFTLWPIIIVEVLPWCIGWVISKIVLR